VPEVREADPKGPCFYMRERRVRRRLENKYHIPSLQAGDERRT